MTQAIYRLKTEERWLGGKQIIKTSFKGISCDMLAVEQEDAVSLCAGDWFADPNDLISKLEEAKSQQDEPKKRGRRKKTETQE